MDICRNRRSARYLQGVPNPYQISYFDLYEQSGQELWTSCKYMALGYFASVMNKYGYIFHLPFYSLTHSVPYTCTIPQTWKTYWYQPYQVLRLNIENCRRSEGRFYGYHSSIKHRWVYRFWRCQRRCSLLPLAGVWGLFLASPNFAPPPLLVLAL